jgi:hypothetical protein
MQGSDGNLYGSTYSYGSGILFQATTSGQYTILGSPSGGCPCVLTQGSDGLIYGSSGATVFAIDGGFPKPAPQPLAFTRQKVPPARKCLRHANGTIPRVGDIGSLAAAAFMEHVPPGRGVPSRPYQTGVATQRARTRPAPPVGHPQV